MRVNGGNYEFMVDQSDQLRVHSPVDSFIVSNAHLKHLCKYAE